MPVVIEELQANVGNPEGEQRTAPAPVSAPTESPDIQQVMDALAHEQWRARRLNAD